MIASLSGPVPKIVTGTLRVSSIFLMNDFASWFSSSNEVLPAQSGKRISNFVMAI